MARHVLTDTKVARLRPAKPGQRYDVLDALMPGLLVRVTASGSKTWMFRTRFPGTVNPKTGRVSPSRRALGKVGAMTVVQARDKARSWHQLLERSIDPKVQQEHDRLAALRAQGNTFASVAEAYLAHVRRRGIKKARAIEREIRNEFVRRWAARPVDQITTHDVRAVVEAALARGAPAQAHGLFERLRAVYAWAQGTGAYGLTGSPTDNLRATALIGNKQHRTRVLTDDEIFACWRAAARMGYPWGPLVQMLLLTGQRLNEVACARWGEFDLRARVWTVPAERTKSGHPHAVPLCDDCLALLDSLPKFASGDHLFSANWGKAPVRGFSKPKLRLDALMLRTLKSLARVRGEAASAVTLPPFVNHDLRRTLRTNLSKLRVPREVAEKCIGHDLKGIDRVYNQNMFLDEMREALTKWEARLRAIVNPPPDDDNVIALRPRPRA